MTLNNPSPQSADVAPYVGPSITVEQMISALIGNEVISQDRLESLLGADRHRPTINALETALRRNDVVSNARLLAMKSSIAGLPVPPDGTRALAVLPSNVAKATGALVLDLPEPVVAFVEDLPMNVERVRATLGRSDFAVWLITAPQFADLYRSVYHDSGKPAEVKPAPASILVLFDEVIRRDATDLHLSAGKPPVMRLNGSLAELPFAELTSEWLEAEFRNILGDTYVDEAIRDFDRDAAYSYGPVRFRINIGADLNGMTAALRRLPSQIPSFDEIGLPTAVREFCELERGLILITGPTGSGKSTTLASMLAYIGLNQSRHILTLEDPIEFIIPSRTSLVHQREMGISVGSFTGGLRQSLRQDPDVILVGEARDRETISAAVTAAETGALVFATLHTYDAVSSLGRMVSTFPEGEQEQIRSQLAYVLKGVVSQTLVPTLSGSRVAAFEVLVCTPAVANNLRKVDGLLQLKQVLTTGAQHGMQTMESHLAQLVRRGVITQHEGEFKARDLDEFHRHLTAGAGAVET
jgi:twitching motility protein PilT